MKINSGGPVHPVELRHLEQGIEGITLRDHFAIQILCAALSNPHRMGELCSGPLLVQIENKNHDITFAYQMADLMIAHTHNERANDDQPTKP